MLLELKNVSKFYYSKGIVTSGFRRVSLSLDKGEFVAITGESGSGKSTLLNVISGLDTYEEGEMLINGEPTSAYSPEDFEAYRRKYIANVFQSFNLVNSYTVYQNVALILQINGIRGTELRQRTEDALKKTGLWDLRRQKASKLSGGQRQRVSIARAFAKATPIIVADEPTGNLDEKSAEEIMKVFRSLSADRLIIVVTHNYEQVEPYATRKIRMSDGRIIENAVLRPKNPVSGRQAPRKEARMTAPAKYRLSWRNTFNITAKFVLLLLVFLFMDAAVLGSYGSYLRDNEERTSGRTNTFFTQDIDRRIIVTKNDRSAFTEEEIQSLASLGNVSLTLWQDMAIDRMFDMTAPYTVGEGEEAEKKTASVTVQVLPLSLFSGKIEAGKQPEEENEAILCYSDVYVSTDMEDPQAWVGLTGSLNPAYQYSSSGDASDPCAQVVLCGASASGEDALYVQDAVFQKILPSLYEQISVTSMTFEGHVYGSYSVHLNSRVPQGKAYITSDLEYSCPDDACAGRWVRLDMSNDYYSAGADLQILSPGLNNDNVKEKLGIDPKTEAWSSYSSFYINPADYSALFTSDVYQVSVYMEDSRQAEQTKAALQSAGDYHVLYIEDTVSGETSIDRTMRMFSFLRVFLVMLIMFFICYFVVRIIMKSRNTYYATLRMLGAGKKETRQLLTLDLWHVLNISYALTFLLIRYYREISAAIPWHADLLDEIFDSLYDLTAYLHPPGYVVLYLLLLLMTVMISSRYARQLFSKSALSAYREGGAL